MLAPRIFLSISFTNYGGMKRILIHIISILLCSPSFASYVPMGIGAGGALSGMAISPYDNLWFVGTDMGTLFKSTDQGKRWYAVNHFQTTFGSDLSNSPSPGFSSDGKTVFHAVNGINPQRSLDKGETFQKLSIKLRDGEHIKYWQGDSQDSNLIFCGTNKGLLRSDDKGLTWLRIPRITTGAAGTFISPESVYHASRLNIWISKDKGKTFKIYNSPGTDIRHFTGGKDSSGTTLAFIDSNGASACNWVKNFRQEWPSARIKETTDNCGYVWVARNTRTFMKTKQAGGDHLKMAENDSSTIYVSAGKKWIRMYGTKIHISKDKGQTWNLKLNQLDWDVTPYQPWPSDRIDYSGLALDIGWWDDGYESMAINKRNSAVLATTGYFFLHSTQNFGETWQAPFTEFADIGQVRGPGRRWKTTGIEVISVYKTKFNPYHPELLYAASADIGGLVSEDAGSSFRITRAGYNSIYDFAFDPADTNKVYAASGNMHDFPNDWHANAVTSNGGIYVSSDRGASWVRLTPETPEFNRQFLSVGYDPVRKWIYGGTQETGMIVSKDNGKSWKYLNEGLPRGARIIPQIEVDEKTGNVYALLTGDAPRFSNHASTGIYFMDVQKGTSTWKLLRKNVVPPSGAKEDKYVWYYPIRFAIDQKSGTFWLVDYENNGNWLMTGVWKSTDLGENWQRVQQITHPTDIIVDQTDPNRVHVSGYYNLDGKWGSGGQLFTTDGGKTWKKNELPALQQNARSVTKDPVDPRRIIYSYFGGGMQSGPDPTY